jgi:hypothetical protein
MNPSEAAKILSIAVTLDPRLKPPSREDAQARAAAWSASLDDDLPVTVAERMIVEHYRESTDGVMPAHVNKAWRQYRRDLIAEQREQAEKRAVTVAADHAVPMPPDVKKQLLQALKATATS